MAAGDRAYMQRWWATPKMAVYALAGNQGYKTRKIPNRVEWKWEVYCDENEFLEISREVRDGPT